jgi:thiosulfate reductase cytochrome b subunit
MWLLREGQSSFLISKLEGDSQRLSKVRGTSYNTGDPLIDNGWIRTFAGLSMSDSQLAAPLIEPLAPPTSRVEPVSAHSRMVRITHWINSISFVLLVISGTAILIAHPRFYWGEVGNFEMPAWLELPIETDLSHTGWGRSLHFLAAWIMVINGVVYVVSGLLRRHVQRHLTPTRQELGWRHLAADLRNHLRLRIPRGGDGPRYSVLQKLAYLSVIFLALPVMILSGLTLSPAVTSAWPELYDLFGGRQSARTVHFLAAVALLLFLLAHLVMVTLSGFRAQLRAMTLGASRPTPAPPSPEAP